MVCLNTDLSPLSSNLQDIDVSHYSLNKVNSDIISDDCTNGRSTLLRLSVAVCRRRL